MDEIEMLDRVEQRVTELEGALIVTAEALTAVYRVLLVNAVGSDVADRMDAAITRADAVLKGGQR